MPSEVEIVPIQAGPVKRFFIDILTRDIELVAAILDLVDNSVDSAYAIRPNGDFQGLTIEIEASGSQFSIMDNCGGISIDAATNYVFRLGRPDGVVGAENSIGQFGVGMKRALFKLGEAFQVDSSTGTSHFTVDLDVADWEEEPDNWLIDLAVHPPGTNGYPQRGTTILVNRLNTSIADSLQDMVTTNRLREELRSKHRMAIERGIVITLNGESLAKTPTVFAVSSDISDLYPLVERFPLIDGEGNEIEIEIYAGVYSKAASDEDAEPEDVQEGENGAGWYVFGNDRLLLAADKSFLTGWGGPGNLPLFHNQYARFRGYVYMRAANSVALPWNTTKTGVESSDPIWMRVRGEMITAGRQVITLLNYLKVERAAKKKGIDEVLPITAILETASQLSSAALKNVAPRALTYTAPNPNLYVKSNTKSISYTVPIDDFAAVAEQIGTTAAASVGRATFEYFQEREVSLD